jgi:Tol biopolymer transport system component
VFALVALWFARAFTAERPPAQPTPPRNGEWVVVSVGDLDPDARPMSRGKPANLFVTGPDGSARLVAGAEGDSTLQVCPAFSPDGSLLAYGQTGGGEKTVMVTGFSVTGELEKPTIRIPVPTSRSFVAPCPVWAPDGHRLATVAPGRGVLIAGLEGSTRLVEVDANGLVEGGTVELEWSPDGSQLALLVSSAPDQATVWLVPADGRAAHLLPGFDPNEDPSDIAWTADGRSVVVIGGMCCPEGRSFVRVIDVATGDSRDIPLPAASDGAGAGRIVASRDDRFLMWRGWDLPLEWVDLEGHVAPVELEYPMTSFPELSPDGQQLLYVTFGEDIGPGQTLIAVPLDGGTPTRYSPSTNGFGDNFATFAWQPI